MKKLTQKYLGSNRFLSRAIIVQGGLICLFLMVFFMPEKLLIAGLMFIGMMLFVNRLTYFNGNITKSNPGPAPHKSEVTKVKLHPKVEAQLEQEEESKQSSTTISNKIINVIEKDSDGALEYKSAKARWRNEINDQAFEKRIQTIFTDIRDVDDQSYNAGIQEIRHLLDLRRESLIAQLPEK